MGVIATQQIHNTGSEVLVPWFAEQRPGDRIILCWQEFETSFHDGPNTTEWAVYAAGSGNGGFMQCYVLEREVTDNEPRVDTPNGPCYLIDNDLNLLHVSIAAILLRDTGAATGLAAASDSLSAPAQAPNNPLGALQFFVWSVYNPSVDSPQLPPGPDLLIRAREGSGWAEVVVGVVASPTPAGPFTGTVNTVPNHRAAYSFHVALEAPRLDPLALQTSEELNGPWADAKLSLALPGGSNVPRRALIDDPLGRVLYQGQIVQITRDDAVTLGFETLLGRMSREKLKASIIARGPFTGEEALEYVLTQFSAQHDWFGWKPVPALFMRAGATTIPLKYDAIRIVLDEENPQTLKEVLDEWFSFLPDFAFRVDADNELVVVQVGEGAPVALSDWDVGPIQSEENRLTVVNRCTIRYRPWDFLPNQEIMEPADFYIRADAVGGTGPGGTYIDDSFFEQAARAHLGKQAYSGSGSQAQGVTRLWEPQESIIAAGDITVNWGVTFYHHLDPASPQTFSGSAVVPRTGQQVTLFSINDFGALPGDAMIVVLKARYVPGGALGNGAIELQWASAIGAYSGDAYIALNGFGVAYVESDREYKATYGLAEHYPDLPGLAQSQDPAEGVGVVEEELELRIVNLRTDRIFDLPGGGTLDIPWLPPGTPWPDNFYPFHQVITQQLLALAKARVQKYFQPRLEYSFPVLAPYILRPEHLGRYVSLPNGRVGVLTAIGRSDAYGPGQAQEASEARVVEVRSLTEALAVLSGYDNAVYEIGRYD